MKNLRKVQVNIHCETGLYTEKCKMGVIANIIMPVIQKKGIN